MARKPKEENKHESKQQESIKLKDALNESKLSPEDIVYIHKHNIYGDEKYLVKDIENNVLNKKVIAINQHYDNELRDSDGFRFIIE